MAYRLPANSFQTLSVDVSNPTANPSKMEWKESDNTVTKSRILPGPHCRMQSSVNTDSLLYIYRYVQSKINMYFLRVVDIELPRILKSVTYLFGLASPSSRFDLLHGIQIQCSSAKFFKLVHALVIDMLCLRRDFCIF